MTAEQELASLKEQSQLIQDQLHQINQRITELTSEQKQG
jgi:prefoldin subunit 5